MRSMYIIHFSDNQVFGAALEELSELTGTTKERMFRLTNGKKLLCAKNVQSCFYLWCSSPRHSYLKTKTILSFITLLYFLPYRFMYARAPPKILASHSKSANRWGARGSGGALTFHCYFKSNKDN